MTLVPPIQNLLALSTCDKLITSNRRRVRLVVSYNTRKPRSIIIPSCWDLIAEKTSGFRRHVLDFCVHESKNLKKTLSDSRAHTHLIAASKHPRRRRRRPVKPIRAGPAVIAANVPRDSLTAITPTDSGRSRFIRHSPRRFTARAVNTYKRQAELPRVSSCSRAFTNTHTATSRRAQSASRDDLTNTTTFVPFDFFFYALIPRYFIT